ncbi:MAG: NAD-dependent epimerase/dehydratase family protein, partial [Candidatus Poseidoniaceae archaeon]|nr:NAD-dependent epimerase/dehydratase family protein [Candidatus Poseidoniaceae archaeon]
ASSAAVYGTADALPLDEDEAGHFHSPYAESKWLNEEQILKAREQGMEALALRLFNVYGTGQRSDGAYAAVIPKFIELISQGDQPIIFGDGLQTRDFIHVDDVAKALLMFSTIPWQERFHHVYNIATETECSLLDLVQTIQGVFTTIRPEIPLLKPLHKRARLGDIQRSAASIQRIQNDTQWSPSIAFEDGLREQILDRLNTK